MCQPKLVGSHVEIAPVLPIAKLPATSDLGACELGPTIVGVPSIAHVVCARILTRIEGCHAPIDYLQNRFQSQISSRRRFLLGNAARYG
jgi:hypothetical protein